MKIKDFQKELRRQKISAALLFNLGQSSPNFTYLSGFTGAGILIIKPSSTTLLVPDMEYLAAKQHSRIPPTRSINLISDMKRLVKGKTIGIDKDHTSLNSLPRIKKHIKAKFLDISPICTSLRMKKTPEEIRNLKKACHLTDQIFQKTFLNFKKFKTEADVAAFMTYQAASLGLSTSFPPIVASGKNSAKPHHQTTTKKLGKGFCIIDFGIRYKGICSDMTRTIYLGSPTQKEVDIYYKVFESQRQSIALCCPGKTFHDIDLHAKCLLKPMSQYMNHSVGHGLGCECHEQPSPKKKPLHILEPDHVITIEPGLYFPNLGGVRIEDDILITKSRPTVLTKTGKNLLIIKR
ncbi:M24 family metallopeptidase [Nanoarchaeota archaeon]